MHTRTLLPALLALLAMHASAKPLLVDGFEALGAPWAENVSGNGAITLADNGVKGKCLRIETREKALAYYTTALDIDQVRGKRISVRAMVKLDNVVRGDRVYSEAKLHALIRFKDPKKPVRNVATRFRGTADWHGRTMVVEVPEDAVSLQIDLGIQNGDGIVYYDNLVIDDGVRRHLCVDLRNITNTCQTDIDGERGHGGFLDAGSMDLRDLPKGNLAFADIDFYVMSGSEAYGRTCIVLAGAERPRLPSRTPAVAPVEAKSGCLHLLHTAAWCDPDAKRPCLFVDLTYADGRTHTITVREGVDVGCLDAPVKCPNWQLAWTGDEDGRKLGVGVSHWPLPWPDTPIRYLRFRSPGNAAVPVVLAVSLDKTSEPADQKTNE